MRRRSALALLTVLALTALGDVEAELISKTYEFKAGVTLQINVSTADGLRLDGVRFDVPAPRDGRLVRTGGLLRAQVSVSNTTDRSRKAALAIALFDPEQRLVAVASGGNRVVSVKAGRQRNFNLVFDGVNAEAHKASTFQISLEGKP